MSLVKPLTTTEGIEGVEQDATHTDDKGEEENLVPIWHTLSYDAFAPADPPPTTDTLPHIAAYKVSAARRGAQVCFAVLVCCLASGIVFGYAALKPVLVAEGVFHKSCQLEVGASIRRAGDSKEGGGRGSEVPCPKQDLRLNASFTSASIALNIATILAGSMLDYYGRRACYLASSVLLAAGCILIGSAFATPEFDGYILGYVLLGLGGTFVFVPSFELAKAFPKHSGLVVALVTGAFDASAAVFLFYRVVYDASNGNFTPLQFFRGFLIVPALIVMGEMIVMPPGSYHNRAELEQKIEKARDMTRDLHALGRERDWKQRRVRISCADDKLAKLKRLEQVAGDADQRLERRKLIEERQAASGVWGALHGLSPREQMMTPWFLLILLLTVLQMLRMNYFIATVRSQYRHMLGSEEAAEAINNFFDIALPVAGVVSTPFIGILLNNLSSVATLAILTAIIAFLGILNCLPHLWAGYLTVAVFVLFRPLYYSTVSDYATKVFGFATFGRIYGSLICVSGLINLTQPFLDELTHGRLRGDPLAINAFMAVIGTLISASLTIFVANGVKELKAKRAGVEEAHESFGLSLEEDVEEPIQAALCYGTMDTV
ncbi:MFS general substrate transporter [Thozetella sp. PMI_491]|nr:MFS general substrate transporter [Thozetella sp. PMI_491]